MRAVVGLLLVAGMVGADAADEYFEVGVDYLKKGFFKRAREAFSESLVRAPGQPVPLAFLGVASAAEGRPPAEAAILLRWAYERMPKERALRLDLRELLPSEKTLALLQDEYRRALAKDEKRPDRLHLLTVLAFLEVHDGDALHAPALDLLLKARPNDAYAKALRPPAATARPD
jgi:hypothetical protein